MTKTLDLFYAPDNASLCVRIALEELGLPHKAVLVDRAVNAQRAPEYLALNSNGLIPVLVTDHGPVFETGAILLWLADTYDGLMPPPDSPARGHALQWLFWISNTLHPTQRMLFYADQYTDGDVEDLRVSARRRMIEKLDVLNNAESVDWLDADAPSAQGCYLGPMLRWCVLYGSGSDWFDLARWPRLLAFAQRAEARPAVKRAAIAEGLGLTPFSAPKHPNPPQGSAT